VSGLPSTPRERAAKEVVKAVQKGRRHVRLPKRFVPFAMLVEVPNRLVDHAEVLTLTGDSYRTRARRELLAKDRTTD
jgi:hypothetical protein